MMVDPPAEEPEPEEQRGLDRIEAFLEIGAVLLGDGVDRHPPRPQRGGAPERIHVPDHRREVAAPREGEIPTPVRRHRLGRERQRLGEARGIDRPRPDQGDRTGRAMQDRPQFQGAIATAEIEFCGDPSMILSE